MHVDYKTKKREDYLSTIVSMYGRDHEDPENSEEAATELSNRYRTSAELVQITLGLERKDEWDNYGSGCATFLDSWFYKPEPVFAINEPDNVGDSYEGVFVLFCLLTPLYVLGSGIKSWSESGGSSYLPNLEMVDHFSSPDIAELAGEIASILKTQGLVRAYRDELSLPLPSDIEIDTNLSGKSLTTFDGFFNWMD